MENLDKVLTAYGSISLDKLIILILAVIVLTSIIVWLIASHGITFKSLSIGGSKKILESSRNDILLKGKLEKELKDLDSIFFKTLRTVVERKKFEFLKELNINCFFVSRTIGYYFNLCLVNIFLDETFFNRLARSNRVSFISSTVFAFMENYRTVLVHRDSLNCFAILPSFDKIEEKTRDTISVLFDRFSLEANSYLSKKIGVYETYKNSFKDPFFCESIYKQEVENLQAIIYSLE